MSEAISIESDLEALNRDLKRYRVLSGKLPEDINLKQGGKLAFNLGQNLKKFAPAKGFVTSERLAALGEGEGIKLRPAAYKSAYAMYGASASLADRNILFGKGKKQVRSRAGKNFQALVVKRELAIRESGRGFIGYATGFGASRFGTIRGFTPGQKLSFRGRYQDYLASVGIVTSPNSSVMTFSWGGSNRSSEVAKVLNEPRAKPAISAAIQTTATDIRNYIPSKTRADAKGSFR